MWILALIFRNVSVNHCVVSLILSVSLEIETCCFRSRSQPDRKVMMSGHFTQEGTEVIASKLSSLKNVNKVTNPHVSVGKTNIDTAQAAKRLWDDVQTKMVIRGKISNLLLGVILNY